LTTTVRKPSAAELSRLAAGDGYEIQFIFVKGDLPDHEVCIVPSNSFTELGPADVHSLIKYLTAYCSLRHAQQEAAGITPNKVH
jgi:hypothetical protein